MHFFAIVVLSALSVSAFPRGNTDNSVIARSASPEDIADAIAESAALLAADKISYDNNPGKTVQCPKTDRYDPHDFTANQIKVAYIGCAKLLAEHKQIGDNNYPHLYESSQQLPVNCGTNTAEFPIVFDNKVYEGQAVTKIPDRVLVEYRGKQGSLSVKYCGVIRHGNGRDFVICDPK